MSGRLSICPSQPLTSTWPRLRCDVGLEKGGYWKKLSLCYSIVYYYNVAQRYEQVSQLYRTLILLGLALCLPSACASVSSVFMVLYIDNTFIAYILFFLLVSWAWYDWPLTWLTNHRPSVLLHCWLGHLTHKIVFEMTYDVWDVKLCYTIPCRLSITCWYCVETVKHIIKLFRHLVFPHQTVWQYSNADTLHCSLFVMYCVVNFYAQHILGVRQNSAVVVLLVQCAHWQVMRLYQTTPLSMVLTVNDGYS